MKEHWNVSKERLVSLEAGPSCNEEGSIERISENNGNCKQLIGCMKLILYIELTLFFGWACYAMWQSYQTQPMEFKANGFKQEPPQQSQYSGNAMRETKNVQSHLLDETEDVLMKINHVLEEKFDSQKLRSSNRIMNSANSEHVISISTTENSNLAESTTTGDLVTEKDENGVPLALINSDEKKPSYLVENSESKENSFEALSQEEDAMVWTFPFLWTIHGLKIPDDLSSDDITSEELKGFESNETNTFNKEQSSLSETISNIFDRAVNQDHNDFNEDQDNFKQISKVTTEMPDKLNHEKLENLPVHRLNWLELPKPIEVEEKRDSRMLHPWFDTPLSTMETPKKFDFNSFADGNFKQAIPTSIPTLMETGRIVMEHEKIQTEDNKPDSTSGNTNVENSEHPKCAPEFIYDPVIAECISSYQKLQNFQPQSNTDWFDLFNSSDIMEDEMYWNVSQDEMLHNLFPDTTESVVKEIDKKSLKAEEVLVVSENPNVEMDTVYQNLFDRVQEKKALTDYKEQTRETAEMVQGDFNVRDPPEENLDDKQVVKDSAVPEDLEYIRTKKHEYVKKGNDQVTSTLMLNTGFTENSRKTEVDEALEKTDVLTITPATTTLDKESEESIEQEVLQLQDDILTDMLNSDSDNYYNTFDFFARLYREMPLLRVTSYPKEYLEYLEYSEETPERILHRDFEEFLHRGIRSIDNNQRNEEKISNMLPDHVKPATLLRKSIREKEALLAQRFAIIKDPERRTLKSNTNNFYSKMEILKEHIDRLHRRYLLLRKLDDDYISREFPPESLEM